MKRTVQLMLLLAGGFLLGAVFGFSVQRRHSDPVLEASLELNDPTHTSFLANRIQVLEWSDADGTVARFVPDGERRPNQTYTVRKGEQLVIPDDHGHTTLGLIEIRDNKARIAYVSTFDHRSFGQNRQSVTCGIVDLPVRSSR